MKKFIIKDPTKYLLLILVATFVFADPASAQNPPGAAGAAAGAVGGQIFQSAACGLLNKVLTKDFGGMLTVIAGSLAILASVTGSFKGAWALVFVSVGCFVYPHTINILFPGMC